MKWVIPDTEIALVRVVSGPRTGEFLFSPETVTKADSFYDRVRHLPYLRPVPLTNVKELIISGGGWMIPHRWVHALPAWLRTPLADQALWKWIGFGFVLAAFVLFLGVANRISQLGRDRSPFLDALAHLALPALVLLGTPVVGYLALVQLNLIDGVGVAVGVAGLGVGGLAIALSAQPTIENLIGGPNLFADKPIRVGDVCKYGGETGTVEAIGIRSTRMRGADRTLTTIPNGALARMPIVNVSRRDRILIQTVIGLRYETTQEQLRYALFRLRELLLGHPRVDPDTVRARFVGFGDSSLNIELFAYVTTRD